MHFHGKSTRNLQSRRPARLHETCGRALAVTDIAVLVGQARTLTPAAIIGRLTECLPTLRGGISEVSPLCSRKVIAHSEAPQNLVKLNAELSRAAKRRRLQ